MVSSGTPGKGYWKMLTWSHYIASFSPIPLNTTSDSEFWGGIWVSLSLLTSKLTAIDSCSSSSLFSSKIPLSGTGIVVFLTILSIRSLSWVPRLYEFLVPVFSSSIIFPIASMFVLTPITKTLSYTSLALLNFVKILPNECVPPLSYSKACDFPLNSPDTSTSLLWLISTFENPFSRR